MHIFTYAYICVTCAVLFKSECVVSPSGNVLFSFSAVDELNGYDLRGNLLHVSQLPCFIQRICTMFISLIYATERCKVV